jgi:hypothetical protein
LIGAESGLAAAISDIVPMSHLGQTMVRLRFWTKCKGRVNSW